MTNPWHLAMYLNTKLPVVSGFPLAISKEEMRYLECNEHFRTKESGEFFSYQTAVCMLVSAALLPHIGVEMFQPVARGWQQSQELSGMQSNAVATCRILGNAPSQAHPYSLALISKRLLCPCCKVCWDVCHISKLVLDSLRLL